MILHNQQAVPRLQIHRFIHDSLRKFCIEFSCFFHVFSVSISGLIFDHIFNGKWLQKDLQNRSPGRPLRPNCRLSVTRRVDGSRPRVNLFSCIDFLMFFGPLSAPFWSMLGPFGSILALVGSMLGPFGSILGTCWTPLPDFCKN